MEKTIVAPGFKTTTMVQAPPAEEHESKRRHAIDDTEMGLVGKMRTLRIQTVEKNREFKRQLDAVNARRVRCKDKLEQEVLDRDKAMAQLRKNLEEALQEVDEVISVSAERKFELLQTHGLDPVDEGADAVMKDWAHFKDVKIPDVIEEQTGEVVRRMQKTRESFDIENSKIRAREAQIVNRFNNFVKSTTERHGFEADDRFTQFTTVREELSKKLSAENREEATTQVSMVSDVKQCRELIASEVEDRENEDATILESLQMQMEKLQSQILMHFGAAAEE